jgi:hypothetical protein
MTPKEKAKELVDKFFEYSYRVKWDIDKNKWEHNFDQSKQCALIAVDEIIKSTPHSPSKPLSITPHFIAFKYWQLVKQEIEEL